MGDRATFAVETHPDKRVYFYAHWTGHNVPKVIQTALSLRERWNDATYLARMLFCHLCHGEEMGTTGFGIGAELDDSSYPILVLRPAKQIVELHAYDGDSIVGAWKKPTVVWTFEEFCGIEDIGWDKLDPAY